MFNTLSGKRDHVSTTGSLLGRLRQPEYTGENRCLPCTAVNAVIGLAASVAVGAGVATVGSPAGGLATTAGVFTVCVLAIYLRGYLVPGTPTLTKRYLPERVLAWFGKDDQRAPTGDEGGLDPERELIAAGALEECSDGEDLCLTEGFRAAWEAEIERVRAADADRERLLELLDVDGAVEYEEYGDAFRARVDERVVGTWESRATFLADLGGATVLADRHRRWEGLSVRERSQLLDGLRLFVETCPACGGRPEFGTDTVESCCSTHEVAAVACRDCGARLFESDPL